MSYKYKEVNINNITTTSGGSNSTAVHTSYVGFPAIVAPTENMSKPYSVGFNISNTDVANSCTAAFTDYTNTTTTNYTVPTGATHFRSILIGGGGGGGGNGGDATATANFNGTSGNANGGNGGTGGSGAYTTTADIAIATGVNTISVTCGAGGNAGSNGGANSISPPIANLPRSTKGGDGNPGGGGGTSIIVYNGSTTNAAGGAGGGGGGGATATVNSSSNTNSTGGGNGPSYARNTTAPTNWTNQLQGNSGVGGVQGINGNPQNATVGQPGAVRIIWLYQ
jgi:hypothetical protein